MTAAHQVRQLCLWTNLRSAGNSSLVKATLLIPLLGYLVVFNENFLHFIQISKELVGMGTPNSGGPIPFRLMATYFGLCFIAVGSALYNVFCPQEIRRHATAAEYIGQGGEKMSILEMRAIEGFVERGDELATTSLGNFRLRENSRPFPNDPTEHRERLRLSEGAVLDIYFHMLNRKHPNARTACGAFFALGFTFLLVPSLDIFVRVIWLASKKLGL